jgi:hypothetical protein
MPHLSQSCSDLILGGFVGFVMRWVAACLRGGRGDSPRHRAWCRGGPCGSAKGGRSGGSVRGLASVHGQAGDASGAHDGQRGTWHQECHLASRDQTRDAKEHASTGAAGLAVSEGVRALVRPHPAMGTGRLTPDRPAPEERAAARGRRNGANAVPATACIFGSCRGSVGLLSWPLLSRWLLVLSTGQLLLAQGSFKGRALGGGPVCDAVAQTDSLLTHPPPPGLRGRIKPAGDRRARH